MRYLSIIALILLAGCASEAPRTAYDAALHLDAVEIDQECLNAAPQPGQVFDEGMDGDDEVYVSAVPAPREGEIFALALENDIEDTLRSLRKKEAFIDKRARFLGYEDGK
ncbi:hypothetical protein IKW72_00875 [bacterium]|nr:hypothetical protein [bacterium]